MIFKTGVLFWRMHLRIEAILPKLDEISERMLGRAVIITAGREGLHSKTSLHYKGRAIDIRINDIPTRDEVVAYHAAIIQALGKGYDVVLEKTHIHIEWDPK